MEIANERYAGEALMSESPDSALSLIINDNSVTTSKLQDGSVTTPKIKDKNVTPEKLSDSVKDTLVTPVANSLDQKYTNITDELYNMIASLQVGGVALSNKFGYREDIGITQKTLTKAVGKIWDIIGEITHKDYMDFKLIVEPVVAYSESAVTVNITADCREAVSDFDSIKIYADEQLIAESHDISEFTTTHQVSENTVIKAVGIIMGKTITKQQSVTKTIPFFMGSGSVYTDIVNDAHLKELIGTLEGDYDVEVEHNRDYIFIIIPLSRKDEFRRADMNGYEIPFEAPVLTSDFVVYKSLNTYNAGTYNIDININT